MKKPYILVCGEKIILEFIVYYHSSEISLSNFEFGEKIHVFGELVKWNDYWVLISELEKTILFICEKKAQIAINLLNHGYNVLEVNIDVYEKIHQSPNVHFYADLTTYSLLQTPEIKFVSPLDEEISKILSNRLNIITKGIIDLWGDVVCQITKPCVCFLREIEDVEMFAGYKCEGVSYRDKYALVFFNERNALPEIHEITHLFLYQLGKPPFLFLEGMPTLMEQLLPQCSPEITLLNSVARNAYIINRKLRISDMLNKEYVYTAQAKNSGAYFVAASFLKWCKEKYGWEKLKYCYVKYAFNGDKIIDKDIFFSVFGISIVDAEKQWIQTLSK